MSIVLQSTSGGSVTINEPTTASNFTQSLPAATGTVMVSGNMPAFSAYLGTNQNLTNSTFTKIQINTENFDTNSNYDNATNYRFTPNVAGYYQINGRVDSQSSTGSVTRCIASIYRNGTEYKRGSDVNTANTNASNVMDVIYFNGSTDYVELYGFISAAVTATAGATQALTYFSGSMVRGA